MDNLPERQVGTASPDGQVAPGALPREYQHTLGSYPGDGPGGGGCHASLSFKERHAVVHDRSQVTLSSGHRLWTARSRCASSRSSSA
jgi:hypothetical protein